MDNSSGGSIGLIRSDLIRLMGAMFHLGASPGICLGSHGARYDFKATECRDRMEISLH